MSGVLEAVNQRTQLVGENRLELLMFRLSGRQLYGINVFKVKEVLSCPQLTVLPGSRAVVRGVASIRGRTLAILDLNVAIGLPALADVAAGFIIITEYNNATQGFLVSSVERIVNLNWGAVHSPPQGSGASNYLTAVTQVDGQLVEILDVERILAEVSPAVKTLSPDIIDQGKGASAGSSRVLVADDSSVARKQIQRCCDSLGLEATIVNDGRQALNHLLQMLARGEDPVQHFALVISDIEMPEMDGYTLTASIKTNPQLAALHVLLHTSLSGIFNQAMVEKVGADDFLAKFHPDELAVRVIEQIKRHQK